MTAHKHSCRCPDCTERVEEWNTMHRAVLPVTPLVKVLGRIAINSVLSPAESQALYRAIRSGLISRSQADTISCRLDRHPSDIWPEWWAA